MKIFKDCFSPEKKYHMGEERVPHLQSSIADETFDRFVTDGVTTIQKL